MQLTRLQEAVAAGQAGKDLPPHPEQEAAGLRRLQAGYADALIAEQQLTDSALAVNGVPVAVGVHGWAEHALLAHASSRHVLWAMFGTYTAVLPSSELVDARPIARAFLQAILKQYDAFIRPTPRLRRRPGTTAARAQTPPAPRPCSHLGKRCADADGPAPALAAPAQGDRQPSARRRRVRVKRPAAANTSAPALEDSAAHQPLPRSRRSLGKRPAPANESAPALEATAAHQPSARRRRTLGQPSPGGGGG